MNSNSRVKDLVFGAALAFKRLDVMLVVTSDGRLCIDLSLTFIPLGTFPKKHSPIASSHSRPRVTDARFHQ